MIRPRNRRAIAAVAAVAFVAAATAGVADGATAGVAGPSTEAYVRGAAALERIGERLPAIAEKYGLTPGELRRILREDPTLRVDRNLELAYFDVAEPAGSAAPAISEPAAGNDPFGLASLPSADKTIYLDFDGHTTTGTTWNSQNNIDTIVSPPYSRDADSAFSDSELQIVRDTWAVVAEDFAPWNVNVTTIDPGQDALRRWGNGDTQWGVRVVVTKDWKGCSCGGFAYLGSFDDHTDEPVFVFNTSFAGVSEAASHEVGHAMLLNHDGLTSGATYYSGHSSTSSTPGWAPIMGASYYQPVTQWSKQEYFGANNTGEDDLAIIGSLGNGNDFGLRSDDHGDTVATATALSGQQVNVPGIIETRADVDIFSFTTSGGAVSFVANGARVGPNLDIELTLRDSSGIVARDNVATALGAGLDANVAAGTYTVEVAGAGVGNPGIDPPSGYSDYASIGRYTLSGDTGPTTTPTDTTNTATGETPVAGTVIGTFSATTRPDGAVQTITEVDSGGKPHNRYDLAEHRWTIPASTGNQTLTVVASASDGSDTDAGFAVEWSTDGSTWVPFADVANGLELDVTASIGAPTGDVHVRVIDTNRSSGNTSHNSISVDFLEVTGDGEVVQPPTATAVVASLSTSLQSAGRGESYGVVTVQVNDNLGNPVNKAEVTVILRGSFSDSLTGTTGTTGIVTLQTSGTARKPSFTACVESITGTALPYSRGTESC